LDFDIDEINNFYNQEIDSNIDKLFEQFDRPLEVQILIDSLYSNICDLILNAKESTLIYVSNNHKTSKKVSR
jgi:hypothetical protein